MTSAADVSDSNKHDALFEEERGSQFDCTNCRLGWDHSQKPRRIIAIDSSKDEVVYSSSLMGK